MPKCRWGLDQPEDRLFAVEVEPDRLKTLKVYVRQPADLIAGRSQSFNFVVEDKRDASSPTSTPPLSKHRRNHDEPDQDVRPLSPAATCF